MKQLIIGLTGPTGAGKSTWTAALENLGCRIIDCDQLAREAVQDSDCIKSLQRTFGEDLISADGLDRKKLAKRAFQDTAHTELLNQITHPVIRRKSCRAFRKNLPRQLSLMRRSFLRAGLIPAAIL